MTTTRLDHLLSETARPIFAVGAFAALHPVGSPSRSPRVRLLGRRPIVHPIDRSLALPVKLAGGGEDHQPLWVGVALLAHRDCGSCEDIWRTAYPVSEEDHSGHHVIGQCIVNGEANLVLVAADDIPDALAEGRIVR